MPVIITDDEKPTYIAKPDMRFATTFLSYKYRDYAVIGESLQDKASGEIYTKRADGRTVSFFQNKKIYEDLCLKARIMLNNNPSFEWPSLDEYGQSYFCGVNYDSLSFFKEKRLDILTTDVVFPNDPDNVTTQFKFNLSVNSNGFFICPTSRDPDKPAIDFLTAKYNEMFENYTGTNEAYALEASKFESNPKWKDSNAIIHYTVTVKSGDTIKVYTMMDYIRINEICCVLIPSGKVHTDFPDGVDSILITIRGIQYYKIHFMVDHYDDFGPEFQELYNHFVYPDNEMYIDWYEVYSFVDKAEDLMFLGNEFVVAFLDVPMFKEYLAKMGTLLSSGGFITSIQRPDDGVWVQNMAWGERMSDIYKGGTKVQHTNASTALKKMEAMLAGVNYISGDIGTDPTKEDDFYLADLSVGTYTMEQVNAMIGNIVGKAKNKTKHIIVRAPKEEVLEPAIEEVTDKGMVLGTVYTTESEESEE